MSRAIFERVRWYRNLWSRPAYESIDRPSSDEELEDATIHREYSPSRYPNAKHYGRFSTGRLAAIGLCCLTAGLILGYLASIAVTPRLANDKSKESADNCAVTPSRQEWSTLSFFEKSDFIRAVRCMSYEASLATPKGALFDDFPYVRAEFGWRTIDAASFLPWNRYFLHIYETTMRETCRYSGNLPYWSWTLDSKALSNAPVFDKTLSFGGNGNPTAAIGVGHSHCVLDGSFSDLQLKIADGDEGSLYQEHCLSRSFPTEDLDGHLAGSRVNLSVLRELIDQPDYSSFLEKLRAGPMEAIPTWIGGDFSQLTGPNDPLFILHLAQLDRLWWMWQIQDPFSRNEEYTGLAFSDSEDEAKLTDIISLGMYLAPDVKVDDVMATNYGGVLCYNYTIL